jgi:hypothetical protein
VLKAFSVFKDHPPGHISTPEANIGLYHLFAFVSSKNGLLLDGKFHYLRGGAGIYACGNKALNLPSSRRRPPGPRLALRVAGWRPARSRRRSALKKNSAAERPKERAAEGGALWWKSGPEGVKFRDILHRPFSTHPLHSGPSEERAGSVKDVLRTFCEGCHETGHFRAVKRSPSTPCHPERRPRDPEPAKRTKGKSKDPEKYIVRPCRHREFSRYFLEPAAARGPRRALRLAGWTPARSRRRSAWWKKRPFRAAKR